MRSDFKDQDLGDCSKHLDINRMGLKLKFSIREEVKESLNFFHAQHAVVSIFVNHRQGCENK